MRLLKKEAWQQALENLKTEYSSCQLAVILNLSHSAVTNRLDQFTCSSHGSRIIKIHKKLLNKEDPRIIFFLSWCERLLKNKYGLLYRLIREDIGLSNKKLNFRNDYNNLCSYESNTNIMPKKLYNHFIEHIRNKNYVYNQQNIKKSKKLIIDQVSLFVNKKFYRKCPSIINILPSSRILKGIKKEYEIYESLKKTFPNTFLGCSLSKNLKRRDQIDMMVIDNKDVIAIEVKDFKKNSRTVKRRLKELNLRMIRLKVEYPEITKLVAILPSMVVSKETKHEFFMNDHVLIDKQDINSFLSNKLNAKVDCYKKPTTHLRLWLDKFSISSSMLQLLLDMNNINILVRNLLRNIKFNNEKTNLQRIEDLLIKFDKRKLHFKVNRYGYFYDKDIVWLRNLRKTAEISLSNLCLKFFGNKSKNKNKVIKIETGKLKLHWLKTLYKNYLNSKIFYPMLINEAKKAVQREKERWRTAEDFPMVVGLANEKDNKLEHSFYTHLVRCGYKAVRNALINDKDLSKMTLNFHHPEVDIIAKKEHSYIAISCKEAIKTPRNTQFLLGVKSEVDRLAELSKKIEFSRVIMVVKAALSDITWRNLRNYSEERKITLCEIK